MGYTCGFIVMGRDSFDRSPLTPHFDFASSLPSVWFSFYPQVSSFGIGFHRVKHTSHIIMISSKDSRRITSRVLHRSSMMRRRKLIYCLNWNKSSLQSSIHLFMLQVHVNATSMLVHLILNCYSSIQMCSFSIQTLRTQSPA